MYQSGFNQKNRTTLGIMGKMLIKGIRVYRVVERVEIVNVGKCEAAKSGKQSFNDLSLKH